MIESPVRTTTSAPVFRCRAIVQDLQRFSSRHCWTMFSAQGRQWPPRETSWVIRSQLLRVKNTFFRIPPGAFPGPFPAPFRNRRNAADDLFSRRRCRSTVNLLPQPRGRTSYLAGWFGKMGRQRHPARGDELSCSRSIGHQENC
jgi:hypothetical protein